VAKLHTYDTRVVWTGDLGRGTSGYRDYGRAHELSADGRQPILGSSDPSFRGDPARWSPEQLLLGSLSQCHLLWYLHLCSVSGVVVVSYTDDAQGTMEETPDGGRFTSVVLRPVVEVTSAEMVAKATALHADAHRACFIANSVNFPVTHEPEVVSV
jgi:organic hydroperoxide reductase OsmC/OhrA